MNRKTYDELIAMDTALMMETIRAEQIANQYKENTRRIRRLLSYNPVTGRNGQYLKSSKLILVGYIGKSRTPYINPKLL